MEQKNKQSELRLGIDIGGTNTKFAVVQNGKVLERATIPSPKDSAAALIGAILSEVRRLRTLYPFVSVGTGVPGSVAGGVVSTDNLPLQDTPLEAELARALELPVKVENDANCACLGELYFGNQEQRKDLILVTLGTGVGGGIVLDGKLRRGRGLAGEVGHIIIQHRGGRRCPCGQRGCLEAYASATALIRMAEAAAKKAPQSLLADRMQREGRLNGKLFFDCLRAGDPWAEKVFDNYTSYLATGITSLINVFDPDAVILSGGITAEGDVLLRPLCRKVPFSTPIEISVLQNDAGCMGAAML